MDLVAAGSPSYRVLVQRPAASRFFSPCDFQANVGFDRRLVCAPPRDGDILNGVMLHLKVQPGHRWKPDWIYSFVKKFRLLIGGQVICETGTEQLRMEHHIHGKRYVEQDGEILIEPLKFADIFLDEKRIPFICLQFHEVRMELQTGALQDCLDEVRGDANALLESCELSCEYMFLDNNERRVEVGVPQRIPVRYNEYCERTFNRQDALTIRIDQTLLCSAAYLWITDEHNNEIPRALDRIEVRLNGQTRWDVSALQSQQQMRALMPHPTQDHPETQNLYYISYFSGRRELNGVEQGLNLGHIDNYTWKLYFRHNLPERVNLHVVHRAQNQLQFRNGLGALTLMGGTPRILDRHEPVAEAQWGAPAPAPPIVFENTDQEILLEDETACLITYAEFREGDQVDQCNQCRKIFGTEALQRWLNGKPAAQQKCPHCSLPFNTANFRRGRAHYET